MVSQGNGLLNRTRVDGLVLATDIARYQRTGLNGHPRGLEGERKAGVPGGDRFGGTGLFSEISRFQALLAGADEVTRPYHEIQWVYICAKIFASAVLQARPVIFDHDPEDDDEDTPESARAKPIKRGTNAACDLLTVRPNDHQSARKFHRAGAIHIKLDGEDIWFLMDRDGRPVGGMNPVAPVGGIPDPAAIVPWRGSNVMVRPNKRGLPGWYKFPGRDRDGREVWFPAHSVVHFAEYDLYNTTRGFGDTEALTRTMQLEFQADRWLESGLRNGGFGGWFLTENKISDGNLRAAQRKLDDEIGNAENRGRMKIVQDAKGVKIQESDAAPKDMDFLNLRKFDREAICSVMGVPPPVAGLIGDVKFTNFEWAVNTFWYGGNGILAYLAERADTINVFYFPRLRGPQAQYRLAYDKEAIAALQEDMTERFLKAAQIAKETTVSFADALRMARIAPKDMPESAEANLVSVAVVPLEHALNPPDPIVVAPTAPSNNGNAPPDDDDDEPDGKALHGKEQTPRTAGFEHRRAYFAAFEKRVLVAGEEKLRVIIKKYLRDYVSAQEKRLREFAEEGEPALRGLTKQIAEAGPLEALLLDIEEWDAKFADRVRGTIADIFDVAVRDISEELDVDALLGLEDPRVVEALRGQVLQLTEGVNSTLANDVKKALLDVLEDRPATIAELQAAVRAQLPELTEELRRVFGNRDARALTIARTESAHAANSARFMVMKEEGITSTTWIDSGDDFVRDSHQALDGQVRNLGDDFLPGLPYPSAPSGPPGEVINCRCIAEPNV